MLQLSRAVSVVHPDPSVKGVVSRCVVPTSPPSVEYALTPLGRELLPVIRAIVSVGQRLKSFA